VELWKISPVPAITCDQVCRFAVGTFDDVSVASMFVQLIEKPCEQDRTGAVDSIKLR
jgi:hypothetical protein